MSETGDAMVKVVIVVVVVDVIDMFVLWCDVRCVCLLAEGTR